MGVHMIRTIILVSAFLLSMHSIVHAENRGNSFFYPGYKQQHLQRIDMNMSPREYEAISAHNQRYVKNTLRSYSKGTLELIGIPERGINLIGAAVGLATRGAVINLNRSETLTLQFKDMDESERAVYFGFSLDW